MKHFKEITVRDLLTQFESAVLAEHQLFLDGKFTEADLYKTTIYQFKKEIINRCENVKG